MNIAEHYWSLQPASHNPDVSEPQSLADNPGGNKNHFMRPSAQRGAQSKRSGTAVVLNLSYGTTSNANEPEYYTYDRYARLVKM